MRQIVGVATVTALALVLGACGGDDEADETTTTEASAEETTTTVAELSDEEFNSQVEPLLADIEAAGTDLCAVLEAASATGPEAPASTEAQVKVTVDAQVAILKAIAASEPVDTANAEIINRKADELSAAAEADGYTTGFLESETFTQVLGSEDFSAAIGAYQTRQASECATPGAAEGETTTTVAG
jgi:hypothetical protein